MSLTTDRSNPCLKVIESNGMQACYLVLSEEERAKGFVRPIRTSYRHVPKQPQYPLRDLTQEEHERYDQFKYVGFEKYPESELPVTGRFWTRIELDRKCGAVTTMGQALAETYARDFKFYNGTYCCNCRAHFPVGEDGEFVWISDGTPVGS